jgi:hypothetical protein
MNQSIARTIMARFNDKRRRAVVVNVAFHAADADAAADAQAGQEGMMMMMLSSFWYSSGKSQDTTDIVVVMIINSPKRKKLEFVAVVDITTDIIFRSCRSLEQQKSMYQQTAAA